MKSINNIKNYLQNRIDNNAPMGALTKSNIEKRLSSSQFENTVIGGIGMGVGSFGIMTSALAALSGGLVFPIIAGALSTALLYQGSEQLEDAIDLEEVQKLLAEIQAA